MLIGGEQSISEIAYNLGLKTLLTFQDYLRKK